MLKELKGFVAGGYFTLSILFILAEIYNAEKQENTIMILEEKIKRLTADKEEVNE